MTPKRLLYRALFGAAVTLVAGVASLIFGDRVGGFFLACPAILPATLTLVEKTKGEHQFHEGERGAIGGAIGLVAFALVVEATVKRWGPPLALLAASAAWLATAVACYAASDTWRNSRKASRSSRSQNRRKPT